MSNSLSTSGQLAIEDIIIAFSLSILEKKTEEEVVWTLVKDCISELNFEDCVIYFINEDGTQLEQKAAHGPKNPDGEKILSPITIPMGQGITGHVAAKGTALIIPDTSIDPRYIVDDESRLSEICVPIKVNGEVIGVIDCEHSEKHFFTAEHEHILTVIAKICAIKLSQLRAEKHRKEQLEETHRVKLQLAQLQTKMLKSHLNPHFVFNTMNAIQYFLTENKKKEALNYLTLFGKVIRYYLGNFEHDLVYINQEVDALSNYLLLQKLRHGASFTYSFIKPRVSALQENMLPPLLFIAVTDEILETYLSEADPLNLQISVEALKRKLTLTFTYQYQDELRTFSGFRKNMISWKDQIAYFNEMKGMAISHLLENEEGESGKINAKLTISIPQ